MEQPKILKTIQSVLAKEFELDEAQLVPEADFNKDLGLDSLDAVDMVIVLENTFGVKMRDQYEPEQMRTIGGLCAFIAKLKNQSAPETPGQP
jgi:acyl carrier protein